MLFRPVESLTPLSLGGPISIVGTLVATSLNEAVLVSDIESGKVLHRLEGDGESISALLISPNGEFLVTASRSLQIHVYSLDSGDLIKTFGKAHDSAIMSLTIDATSTLAATGGAEGAVKVWDLRNHRLTHNMKGHGSIVTSLSFFGQLGGTDWRLASGADDGKLIVWDLVKSKAIANLENHTSTVTSLQWTSKGDSLLSGGRDKVLSIWSHMKLAATIPVLEDVEAVTTIQGRIVTGSPQSVRVWSLSAEVVSQWELNSEESELVNLIRVSDSSIHAILSDQSIVMLDVSEEGSILQVGTLSTNHGEIIDLLVSDRQVALATNSKDVRVVDLDGNLMQYRAFVGHKDIVISIDALGRWLLSGGKDKEARLWDMETGECKVVFTGHTGSIGAVSLSRGGEFPQFVLTGSQDLTIKKWGADGQAEYTRKAHEKDINTLDVAPSNRHFATGSQDRTIKIWGVDTGEVVGLLRGHRRGVWSVRFAPQNTLVSGSGDKTVRMWSLNDYSCIRTFEGHMNSVLKVVSFDAHHIASAGGDGLIKLWDTNTSECVSTLDGHDEKVWSLTKSKEQLISGGGDGVLKVWQDCTEEEQIRVDKEEEEELEQQQELENSVRAKEWEKAIALALKLNRPLRLLKLFAEVAEHNEDESITGLHIVDRVLQSLEGQQLLTLLERVRDWNTNGRTSLTAQTVLHVILKGPDSQRKMSDGRVLKLIHGIIPYTQRHLTRTEDMLERSCALDYTIKEMTI